MISTLMQTDSTYVYTFLRIVAGIVVLPYGMQKLFGWSSTPEFGPQGISGTLAQITAKNIPKPWPGSSSSGSRSEVSPFLPAF
jgi:putative oxidoreductase